MWAVQPDEKAAISGGFLLSILAAGLWCGGSFSFQNFKEMCAGFLWEEDKEKLFQEKVKELQLLFQKESLDKLKDMSFIQDEQFEDTTGVRLADEGDGEGQEGDSDQQIEIDWGNQINWQRKNVYN